MTPTATGSDDAAGTGNLRNDTTTEHTTGGDIVAAIGEMVDKLVASELRALRSFTKLGGKPVCGRIRLPCFGDLRNMVRYTASQSSDGMAGLDKAYRQRFAISQHGRWRQERDLYTLRQQPGQEVASLTAVVLKAAHGLEVEEYKETGMDRGGCCPEGYAKRLLCEIHNGW